MANREIETKLHRLGEFLRGHNLDGVLLQQRNNFAWITGGCDNHVANNSPAGVTAILATADSRLCLANTIEAPRMRTEELAGTGIDTADSPWWDAAAIRKRVQEIIAGRRIACDVDAMGLGLPVVPPQFNQLRWTLTDEEIARYRQGAQKASQAMEDACGDISPGDTEFEIAGVLDDYVHRTGANPVVTLVATDQRVFHYRHPIPTAKKLERYAMLVSCAEYGGLISSLTRFVHFGRLPDELRHKQQAVCNVDTAVNLATRPGQTLGQIFQVLQKAYADNGHPDQWQLHHQGGPTGYNGREAFADPSSTLTVLENQAYAWNPSITGVKSEDTIIVKAGGIEVLTAASKTWPKLVGHAGDQSLDRPDILLR